MQAASDRPLRDALRRLAPALRSAADRLAGGDAARMTVAAVAGEWAAQTGGEREAVADELGVTLPGALVDAVREWPEAVRTDVAMAGWTYQFARNVERAERRRAYVRTQHKASAADVPLVTQLYTPRFMVRALLAAPLGVADAAAHRVLDPAAGSGQFLIEAWRLLVAGHERAGRVRADAAVAAAAQLAGYDIDAVAIALCRCALEGLIRQAGVPANALPPLQLDAPADAAVDDALHAPFGSRVVGAMDAGAALGWAAANPAQVGALVPGDWPGCPPLLQQRYTLVATNPPFLDRRELNADLMAWLKRACPLAGAKNLAAAFVERALGWLPGAAGTLAMVLPQPLASLPAFAALRRRLLECATPELLVTFNLRDFREATVDSMLLRATTGPRDASATCRCIRLVDADDAEAALDHALDNADAGVRVPVTSFADHPRSAFVGWLPALGAWLGAGQRLGGVAKSRQGMSTNDNRRFLRFWWQVQPADIGPGRPWVGYAKGGEFSRWAGNLRQVVWWDRDGADVRELARQRYRTESRTVKNTAWFFRAGLTYTLVSSKGFSARALPPGCIFDVGGACTFPPDDPPGLRPAVLAWLNSLPARALLDAINPTVNHQVGDLDALPWPAIDATTCDTLADLTRACIRLKRHLLADVPAEPWTDPEADPWSTTWSGPTHTPPTFATDGRDFEHALAGRLAFRRDIWAALRTLEAVIDQLWFDVMNLAPADRDAIAATAGCSPGWLPLPPAADLAAVADLARLTPDAAAALDVWTRARRPPTGTGTAPAETDADRACLAAGVHPLAWRPDATTEAEPLRIAWAAARLAGLRDREPGPIPDSVIIDQLAPLRPDWIAAVLPAALDRAYVRCAPIARHADGWHVAAPAAFES